MASPIVSRWLILTAVMLAFLPVVIDMTILHVAVPSLTQALRATNAEVLWIIDVYPLLMAGLLVPMGTLADRLGNRRLLTIGLALFGTASLIAAYSQTPSMLIGARMLLALGGSMIMPCVLGIIRRTFEDQDERAFALGIWGTVSAAGAAVGPLVGGVLLERFWWGAVFLVNVPLAAMVIAAAYALLPSTESIHPGTWKFGQAVMLITGIIAIVYGIKAGMAATEPLLIVAASVMSGMGLLSVFARKQVHSPEPMLDLGLFAHPAIFAGIVMAFSVTGVLAGVELTLAMELQYVLGHSPLQAGIFMIPIMVAAAIGGPLAGSLSSRFGLRWVATSSLIISASSLAFLPIVGFEESLGLLVLLAVLGLALSIGLTASSIAIMSAVDASKGAAAGSLEATAYELGAGLGITFFGVFMSGVFKHSLTLPPDLDPTLAARAAISIGDSFLVAQELSTKQAAALLEGAKIAFASTTTILLGACAVLLGLIAVLVFLLLKNIKTQ